MELLCPAGNMESLAAAVQNGADAVYLGASRFNARNFAGNFDDMEAAISYAHLRGVKVHLTLNTLVLDREFPDWVQTATEGARAGADAFIVQDLGGAALLRRLFPDVPLHASTQMTIHNTPQARVLEKLGFSRVVLARELSLAQIREIRQNTQIELEVFAHGALCVCWSGQCQMSAALGGRSANRGACAQPCRLQYQAGAKRGHLLNLKDLCLLDDVDAIRDLGVSALKIEGRMKRAEYVAAAARAYRKAIDGKPVTQTDRDALALAFSRGGFTRGLFAGEGGRLYPAQTGHTGLPLGVVVSSDEKSVTVKTSRTLAPGDEIAPALPDARPRKILSAQQKGGLLTLALEPSAPNAARSKTTARGNPAGACPPDFQPGMQINLLSSAALSAQLRESISADARKTPLTAQCSVQTGERAVLTVRTGNGLYAAVQTDTSAKPAQTRPLAEADVRAQLEKTGGTPFVFSSVEIEITGSPALSKSALNELRRRALAEIAAKILDADRHEPASAPTPLAGDIWRGPSRRVAVQAHTKGQLLAAAPFADILCVPLDCDFLDEIPSNKQIIAAYPPIVTDGEYRRLKKNEPRFPAVLLGGLMDSSQIKCADAPLNAANSRTLAVLHELGFSRATLSPELSGAQIAGLLVPPNMETELLAYGRQTLMITDHCPVDCGGEDCAAARGAVLRDRKGMEFPLLPAGHGCRVRILNALPLWMADRADTLRADVLRLVFTTEPPAECADIAQAYRRALAGEPGDFTRKTGFTRGHFFHGMDRA